MTPLAGDLGDHLPLGPAGEALDDLLGRQRETKPRQLF